MSASGLIVGTILSVLLRTLIGAVSAASASTTTGVAHRQKSKGEKQTWRTKERIAKIN
jgi:hypothetical protein